MSTPSPERIITEAIHRILRRDLDASIEPARHVVSKLADAGYSIVQVPVVGYKAVGESDAQRYLNIANRIEDGYHVGGSNSRGAVSELLRRVADTLPAATEGETS